MAQTNYKLYQVAIIELPKRTTKKNEDEEYAQAPRMVLEPITIVESEQDAAIKVAMKQLPELKGIDQERMEVIVRPF